MNRQCIISLVLTLLQVGSGFVVLFGIYMIFALLDSGFGIDGPVGLIIFQPVPGCIISALTIVVCFIIGLPLHFNRRINRWWKKHFYLSIIMLFAGLLALLLLFPSFAEEAKVMADGYEAVKNVPNRYLSLAGWFLTAFSILHLYPASFSFSKNINSRARTVIRIAVTIVTAAASVASIIAVLFRLIFLCHPDDNRLIIRMADYLIKRTGTGGTVIIMTVNM